MFKTIFTFELSYWVRNVLVYVFGSILFAIPFLTMWGMSAEANVGDNRVMMNSYYKINNMAGQFSLALVFLLPAFIGNSFYRDYKSRMYTFLYSFPFTKLNYIGAKFLSAFTVVAIILMLMTGGFIAGSLMPGVKKEAMLPFDILNYLHLIFVFLLPNMLFFAAVVMAIILYTRNIYISFIGIILMIIIQSFGKGVLGGYGFDMLAALCDPTGDASIKYTVRYWTLEERNFNALPVSGAILYNRLLWLAITSLIIIWTYIKFDFGQFSQVSSKKSKLKKYDDTLSVSQIPLTYPALNLGFTRASQWRTAWHLSNLDFRSIVLSWPFIAILFAGGCLVLFQQYQMGPNEHGFVALPTTANMLRFPVFFFSAIINLLTFLYAGLLIHRDRLYHMDGFIDSTPQPNWIFLVSKVVSLVKMQFVLLTMVLVGGLISQILSGYHRFEFGHYFFELYVLQGIHFFAWAALALTIHAIFRNMYLGYFVLILVPVINIFLPSLGDYLDLSLLKENLLQFNSVRDIFIGFDYSDFNGYGWQLTTYFSYKFYWLIGSVVFLIISLLVWKRGFTFGFSERWAVVRSRFQGRLKYSFLFGLMAFVATGCTIYYQEHVVSKVMFFDSDMKELSADNEKQYGHLEGIVQPRLCDVNMRMDIYPKRRDFEAKGVFTYVNKLQKRIDTIVIAKSFKEQTSCLVLEPHKVLVVDDKLKYEVVLLDNGLFYGDSVRIEYEIKNYPNTFLHHNSRVISNGTYLTDHILPRLGFKDIVLSNQKDRKKYGLRERVFVEETPLDSLFLGYENPLNNMGKITYQCTLSTSSDQESFTLGTIKRKWKEGERNFALFQSKEDVPNTLSWLSARYEKGTSSSSDQFLELYRHPFQDHNDQHFLNGLSASLDYCSDIYGRLSYDTMRIIEFPETQGTYATVHGNIMPYSESYFKCDIHDHDNEMFNIPFFVSAHEVAHSWWGHRVDPANVPGGRMISEGMADYIAMRVVEQKYSRDHVDDIRERYHRYYLEQRAQYSNETPLIYSDLNNEYLNYRKSSLALYAISEMIGVEKFNNAMASFESRYNNTEPPFATSLNFVDYIRKATPDSLQYLVHDLFESITLYDNELIGVEQRDNTINISFTISKYNADKKGKRSFGSDPLRYQDVRSLPMNDYIDIGLYDSEDQLISNHRVLITDIYNEVEFMSNESIHEVRIDPALLIFDVNRDNDNWINDET